MQGNDYYLFRHAIMRDAAYLLHPVTLRGTLHRIALELLESHFDMDLPEAGPNLATSPLPVDAIMAELARHARFAQDEPYANLELLRRREAQFLARAGNHAEANYDHEESLAVWRRLSEIIGGKQRFWALYRLSQACRALGRADEAQQVAETAQDLARAECGVEEIVVGLGQLGLIHWGRGDHKRARSLLEQAVEFFGQGTSKRIEANTIGMLGMVHEQSGEIDEARRLYLRAIELLREVGDRENEGVFLQNLGGLEIEFADAAEGERLLYEAIAVYQEIGDHTNHGIALNNLALHESSRGELARAVEFADQAMRMHKKAGNRRSLGLAFANRSHARRKAGDLDGAAADLREALAIHREVGNAVSEGKALCDMMLVELARGNVDLAREFWSRGVGQLRRVLGPNGGDSEVAEMREACTQAGFEPFE
ncbi:MAG: tetratricopeptide repeat protein [Planctomycetes bacterium]|nr:tetratricopeptide repeat protein [Planctomycetota bacterium]